MAKHDIVTYNPTTQGFETELGDNTAQIKGDGTKIFSVESGSTEVFSVGIDNTSITLNSNLTASGDISSSLASTASFGRLEFTKISGDGSQLTNVNEIGHVSGAAQIASRISGAFDAGFTTTGDISGSATSSGSFGRVFAAKYVGDASQMTNVNEEGHFSGSAQLASDISGSFNKGFEYTGSISGSDTSTGSFGRVKFAGTDISGDASQMTSVPVTTDTVSGSAQLAADISGSFNTGFLYDGTISGSMTSTASFHVISASTYVITNVPDIGTPLQQIEGAVSASSQLVDAVGNSRISGSFNKGFEFSGQISGSGTSTGSFTRLDALELVGDGSRIGGLTMPSGLVTASAQLANQISGSFNKGFEYTGTISGSETSTGSFGRVDATTFVGDFSAVNAPEDGYFSGSAQLAADISGSFNKGFEFTGKISGSVTSTGSFGLLSSDNWAVGDVSGVSYSFPNASCTLSDLASDISGSFKHGIIFDNKISGSDTSTGSLSIFKADTVVTDNMSVGSFTDTNLMPYQSSSFRSHTNKPYIIPYVGDQYYDSRQYVPTGSQLYSCGSCAEFSNGYNTADGQLSIGRDGILNISFQSSSLSVGPGGDAGKTAGAWSAGPNLITGTRPNMFGTANAAVTTGGATTQAEGSTTNHVQHYNGISFRLGPDTPRTYGAAGRGQGYGQSENDLALMRHYTSGGVTDHLQYGGHSWWKMTINSHVQRCNAAFGSQNAAVMTGGEGSDFSERAEEWNGHSWNIIGDAGQNRGASGAGTQNAGIIGPGQCSGGTQTYDGTTWSAASNAGAYSGASGAGHLSGTQNDAIGNGTSTQATWDGTAWATIVAKPEDRHQAGLAGGSGVAFLAGGGPNPGSSIATTLEWNNSFNTGSFLVTKKIDSNFS